MNCNNRTNSRSSLSIRSILFCPFSMFSYILFNFAPFSFKAQKLRLGFVVFRKRMVKGWITEVVESCNVYSMDRLLRCPNIRHRISRDLSVGRPLNCYAA